MIPYRTRKSQPDLIFSWRFGAKILSFIVFLVLVIFSFYQFREARLFPIREVKVFGVHHADPKEMQRLLIPLVNKSFFAIELGQIREQLLSSPWIADVSVRRVWPDQIFINLSERAPLARWNNSGFLSSMGDIFTPPNNTDLPTLPQFIGPDGEQIHMLQYYTRMNSMLMPLHVKITRLELTPYLSWNITLDSGMKVNAGYKDLLTRISHFVKVYPKIVGKRSDDVDYVDLRYPNGFAVRWKSVT